MQENKALLTKMVKKVVQPGQRSGSVQQGHSLWDSMRAINVLLLPEVSISLPSRIMVNYNKMEELGMVACSSGLGQGSHPEFYF